jgi:hypothetical protein
MLRSFFIGGESMEKALEVVLNEINNGRSALYIMNEYEHIFDHVEYSEKFVLHTLIASLEYLYDNGYEIVPK